MTETPDVTACATWAEIHQQPAVWTDWAPPLAQSAETLRRWIAARGIEELWLSGAGSSAFIGDILAAEPTGAQRWVSLPTTDFVAAPRPWLARAGEGMGQSEGQNGGQNGGQSKRRILSVQFGRSGDSSESVGMLDLLDAHGAEIDRLHITCNPHGALATRTGPGPGETQRLVLPAVTHDAGFAMTSSFTTMLLSARAILGGEDPAESLPRLAQGATALLDNPELATMTRPDRAIFLGSGALTGAAREAALKVLELTAGKTVTLWDSALGFRHGPKAAMEPGCHVFVFLHPDPHTRRYDADIAAELREQFPQARVTALGPGGDIAFQAPSDPALAAVLCVLPMQVLAARWSAALGLPVDDPFRGHALSRVVSGVRLHELS